MKLSSPSLNSLNNEILHGNFEEFLRKQERSQRIRQPVKRSKGSLKRLKKLFEQSKASNSPCKEKQVKSARTSPSRVIGVPTSPVVEKIIDFSNKIIKKKDKDRYLDIDSRYEKELNKLRATFSKSCPELVDLVESQQIQVRQIPSFLSYINHGGGGGLGSDGVNEEIEEYEDNQDNEEYYEYGLESEKESSDGGDSSDIDFGMSSDEDKGWN